VNPLIAIVLRGLTLDLHPIAAPSRCA